MPANTFADPAPRRHPQTRRPAVPREAGEAGEDDLSSRLSRRLRDLAIMAVVGPAAGMLAIVAIHFGMSLHQPASDQAAEAARLRESERALAILEDRPYPGVTQSAPALQQAQLPTLTAADFRNVQPTPDARRMADWVVARHDNAHMPFMVLDKRDARLYVFQSNGQLVDQTPVLLGAAHGDETYPGIGDVPIAKVRPYQRTTAAGRFVTRPGLDADRTDVVWLDYDAALAMHRVINKVKSERRLQRLASPDPKVRRISWGCINIPIAFFDQYISPVYGKRSGVTYVIPERKSFADVFEKAGGVPQRVATASTGPLAPKDVAQR